MSISNPAVTADVPHAVDITICIPMTIGIVDGFCNIDASVEALMIRFAECDHGLIPGLSKETVMDFVAI